MSEDEWQEKSRRVIGYEAVPNRGGPGHTSYFHVLYEVVETKNDGEVGRAREEWSEPLYPGDAPGAAAWIRVMLDAQLQLLRLLREQQEGDDGE